MESHEGMGARGITRPMPLHEQMHSDMKMGEPYSTDRREMLQMHRQQTQWIYWSVILLGAWLILSPLTFGYDVGVVHPSGGRSVWLSLENRSSFMKWSDILSGIALLIFGWRSLKPNRPISGWMICGIGVWLSAAPILFWAPTAVAYMTDTFVGAWLIALSILIPGMPNMAMYMEMGAEKPPGWSYNPSSWPQRWIMIVTGFLGWMVSRYLAAFQLGYIDTVWDPFFGESTRQVLNSKMSHSLPISDAGMGSLAYTFEFLMGFMGSPSRWRTMPWMVTLFGILVIPLGLVHVFLVISQPVMVGYWCTFCLLAAAIMLPMIPLEIDEVIAMGQFLRRSKKRGESFWKTFWKGGSDPKEEKGGKDERSPQLMQLPDEPIAVMKASVWGMSVPWTLIFTAALGIWMTFAPSVFTVGKPYSDFTEVGGLLVFVFSILAMGEVIRTFRWVNIALGFGLAAVPFFVGSSDGSAGLPAAVWINQLAAGLAIAALSLPRGKIHEHYGNWDRMIH